MSWSTRRSRASPAKPPRTSSARTTTSLPRSGCARIRRGGSAGARNRHAPVVRGRRNRTERPAADLSGLEGRLPRQGRAQPRRLRHLAGHHRAARSAREPEAHPGSAVPLAEDGSGRATDRRSGARFQQHPGDHPRQRRAAAGVPPQGSIHRGDHRRGHPRHAARQGPHRPPARVRAGACSTRRRWTSTSWSAKSCGCSAGPWARRSG